MSQSLKQFAERMMQLIPGVQREFIKHLSGALKKDEITIPQMAILQLLLGKGSLIMRELAECIGVSTSAATGMVDRMVKSKLMKRAFDPKDRRIIRIELTQKGRDLAEEIFKEQKKMITKAFGQLTEKERHSYLEILEKIYRVLTKETKR